jgi:hypothetical protein
MDERIIRLLGGDREEESEGYSLLYKQYYQLFRQSINATESALRQAFHEAVVELYFYLKGDPKPITNLKFMVLNRARWCFMRRYRIDQRLVEFQSKHELREEEVEIDESLVQTILRESAETCRLIFDMIFRQEAAAWRVAEHFDLKNEKVAKDKIDRCIQEARKRMRKKD